VRQGGLQDQANKAIIKRVYIQKYTINMDT
jgi:hypothetical protein